MPWVKQMAKGMATGAAAFGALGAAKGVLDLSVYRGDFNPYWAPEIAEIIAEGNMYPTVTPPESYTEAAIDQGSVGALTGVAAGAALTYAEERRRRRALMRNPTGRPDRAATTGGDVWVDRPRDIGAGRSSAPRHRRIILE